jgi:signal transduction histidine kinase
MLSSGVDVTERRRMEKLLIEQASLARLGEMAAVVAHEVKNPLAGISGALQLIVNQLPREGSGRTMVHEILERLNALNNSVDDLLLFARPRLPRLAPVPLLSLVHDTVALLKQDPRLGDIAVETFGEDLIVTGDAELLKPVFLNLFINAAQAMNGKGTITVAVEAIDGRCRVSLKDTGPGIPAQVLERVFEPFFSTKHRGTGLGLPISKRIVEAHGGRISLVSPAGGGTTVSLELPVATRSGG